MKFELICNKNEDYVNEVQAEIYAILKEYPHSITIIENRKCLRLVIESNSVAFNNMKHEILEKSLTYLLYSLKRNHYLNGLIKLLPINHQYILNRVMIFSELETEKMLLFEKIKNNDIISLDGVSNFLVNDLRAEWGRACYVVNANMQELKDDNRFDEFIKSMSGAISSKYKLLYLFCGSECILLSDKLEKISATYLECEKLTNEYKLVSALVENYPENVAIYEKNNNEVVEEALQILFDSRKKLNSIKSV